MMETETQSAPPEVDQRKSVKRTAMVFSTCTIANCPLESVCLTQQEEGGREVRCGYYLGSLTYGSGSQVVCGYRGN